MNIQARNVQLHSRSKTSAKSSLKNKMLVVFSFVVICSAVFVILNTKIALQQEISDIEHNIAVVQNQINQLERESEDLELKIEKLTSWPHIKAKIAQFQLPLRPATASQNTVLYKFRSSKLVPDSATANIPAARPGI
jgi:cell division protein FtsL